MIAARNQRGYIPHMAYASIARAVKDKRAQLEAAQVALKAAEQHVRVLEVELGAWIEAEALLSKEAPTEVQSSKKSEAPAMDEVRKGRKRAPRKRGPAKTKRTRAPKGYWLNTMKKLALANKDFGLSDVSDAASELGTPLNPAAIRSQMAHYVASGLLGRVKPGVFCFTQSGKISFSKKEVSGLSSDLPPSSDPLASRPPGPNFERKLDEIA